MRLTACRIAVVLLATIGLCALALAASRDPGAAEALFIDGRRAMAQRDYQLACVRFEASQRLDPAVGTLLNLAFAGLHGVF